MKVYPGTAAYSLLMGLPVEPMYESADQPPKSLAKVLGKIADDAERSYWNLRNWLDNHPKLDWVHGDDGPCYPLMQLACRIRVITDHMELRI